jgi:hypothetical protein
MVMEVHGDGSMENSGMYGVASLVWVLSKDADFMSRQHKSLL